MNEKEKIQLSKYIDFAFSDYSEAERKEFLEYLVNQKAVISTFVQYIGNNIAKVGVKQKIGDIKMKTYLSTKYDNELLDD